MRLTHHPDLIDRLAAAYALGSLRHGARRRFESLARAHAPVQAAVLLWQVRLARMTEIQPSVVPDPSVWVRIDNLLRGERDREAQQVARGVSKAAASTRSASTGWHSLLLWRAAAFSGVLTSVLLLLNADRLDDRYQTVVAGLQQQLNAAPLIEYVAVLSGDQSGTSILVQFDPKNQRLTLKQTGSSEVSVDKSLQLWALLPNQTPRSLGVLDRAQVQRIGANLSAIAGVSTLAISLEPRGGVPSERGPTGPVVYQGALLKTVL